MILALEKQKYHLELKLKTEFGVPAYIVEPLSEFQLTEMIRILPLDPWQYYSKENGFSIKLCERLADKFKVDNQVAKAKAYLEFTLDSISGQGHCYGKEWQVKSKLKDQGFTDYELEKAIVSMSDKLFVSDKGNYFLTKLFYAEKNFADLLKRQNAKNGKCSYFQRRECESYNILNDKQKSVVDAIEENGLIILTGLPGTGKTTTVRAIVDAYDEDNVVLLAPTGKAVARLTELCGLQGKTLHSYFFNPQSPLPKTIEDKIIIVDECSMLDVEIAGFISEGIKEGNVLILVGDPDQLPSVGPGQILKDILDAGIGFTVFLNKIMRQFPGSIIKSAHSIHAGSNIITESDNQVITYFPKDFDLIKITTKLTGSKEWKDAQILSCLRDKGSKIINDVVRSVRYPNSSNKFEVGDKIIHTVNNKDLNVFNGEMGIVVRKTDRITIVEFDNKVVEYSNSLLWQLDYSYCITIHKSQGSEMKKVVLFLQPSQITTRNLLYTAITRAKDRILIVAPSEQVVLNCIANKQKPRQCSLPWMLK